MVVFKKLVVSVVFMIIQDTKTKTRNTHLQNKNKKSTKKLSKRARTRRLKFALQLFWLKPDFGGIHGSQQPEK